MKINKERIRENSVKCKNTMQITLDDDFNVPDSKADIDSIIREWGNPHADSVKVSGERAEVKGSLDFAFTVEEMKLTEKLCRIKWQAA